MNEFGGFTRRRMTVPSTFRTSGTLIRVTPPVILPETDEGFFETIRRPSYSRSFPDLPSSPITFPKLYDNGRSVSSIKSESESEIVRAADLFTIEMGKQLEGKQQPTLDHSSGMFKLTGVSHRDSFFCCMRPFLYLAQVFALLPVNGISGPNHGSLRFRWLHWKVAYTLTTIFGISTIFIFNLVKCISYGFSYDRSAPLVFYASGAVGCLFFLDLARNWPALNNNFGATELLLRDYGYPQGQRRKFLIITVLFAISALVEHVLSLTMEFMRLLPCRNDSSDVGNFIHMYFLAQYEQLFSVVNYHIVLSFMVFTFNFLSTCCWNFMDLFLGLVGLSLSSRLHQINKALLSVQGQDKPSAYWRKMREEFNAMSVLIKNVDGNIQKLMLLSLGDNLFFICLQLLKSLRKRINMYQVLYFFWSFGFLILRTCFVTLCAAGVYDESREAKTVLFSVPHQSFCHEVRRFLTQLCTDELTLTGCRFFSVTRGLILTIAGTVVTYEIVLVQFKTDIDADEWPSEQNKTNCAIVH